MFKSKKINLFLVLTVFFINLLCIGCSNNVTEVNESNELFIDSLLTNKLNKELENYFEITGDEGESVPIQSLSIQRIKENKNKNKYLISIEKREETRFFCAYLNNEIKEVLDRIDVSLVEGDLSWYIWLGENYYLKKYEYAIENKIIDKKEYPIKWMEVNNEEKIKNNFQNLFLICIAECFEINVLNFDTGIEETKKVILELNSIKYFEGLDKKEGFFSLTNVIIDGEYINSLDLFRIIHFNSIEYKIFNNEVYLNSYDKNLIEEFKTYDHIVYEDNVFYKLNDLLYK